MEPTLSFFAVVNTLGVLQCILSALALFSIKTGNQLANRFLGIFLLALAIFIIDLVIIDNGFHQVFPYLWGVTWAIDYLITPPLFLYVKALTTPKFKFAKKHLWHFVPFLVVLLLESEKFFLTADAKRLAYQEALEGGVDSNFYSILIVITHIYILIYLYVCYRLLTKAFNRKENVLPVKTTQNIKWLKNLIAALVGIVVLSAILDFLPGFSDIDDYLTPFFLTMIVYGMGFIGIRQSEIFTIDGLKISSKKYEKSVLTDEMADDILERLQQLMKNEEVFIDSSISLPKLAGKLRISTHHLSQILNERLNRSFFNYINEHRVKAAKQKLLEPESEKYTMLELAYDVGFNSLSAFNTAFKKHTGMSPTAYKKQNV